jgi:hypothetical protein
MQEDGGFRLGASRTTEVVKPRFEDSWTMPPHLPGLEAL